MTSKCEIKSWNPPQCNIRILDLRKNKNLQEFKDHSTQNALKTLPLNSLSEDLFLRCRDARHFSFASHVPLMFL